MQGKKNNEIKVKFSKWWAREDSNLQPSGYEPLALTIELRARAGRANAAERATHIIVSAKAGTIPAD